MGNPVTWFEIYSANPAALHDFYGKVFGWKLQPMGGTDYAVVDTDSGQGIGGGIGKAEGPNQTIFSIEVDDPQAFLESVEANGGKTVVPVTETPGVVTFAQFADPQGNIVGLFKWAS
jgi:predicted enzyme related to lactoylglutathione lyase